jgi:hypothetical protein
MLRDEVSCAEIGAPFACLCLEVLALSLIVA